MTDGTLVTLHDAEHRRTHVRVVLLRSATGDWAVATPWPTDIGPFAVAVTTAQGSQWVTVWNDVRVLEVTTPGEPTVVIAAMQVTPPAGVAAVDLSHVDEAAFDAVMAAHPDPLGAMAAVAPDPFDALTSAPVGTHALHAPTGGAPAAALSDVPRVVEPTPRPQFPHGICHLLGWD